MLQLVKLAILLLIVPVSFVSATFGQDNSSALKTRREGNVEISFDKNKNKTTVKLNEESILKNDSESLSLTLTASYTGQDTLAFRAQVLFVLNAVSKERRFSVKPQLVVTADGKVIRTKKLKNYGSRTRDKQTVEPLTTTMPFDIVAAIGRAKKVTFKINDAEYELTTDNLKAVRDFTGYLLIDID